MQEQLRRVCARVVWLRAGRVHQDGAAQEVPSQCARPTDERSGDFAAAASGGFRCGTGQVRIASLQFEDVEGRPTGQLPAGAGLVLRLRCTRDGRVPAAHLGVSLRRVGSDASLVDLTTNASGVGAVLFTDEGGLRLVLDRVDFEPGVYWLDCGAYAVDWESVYDHRRDWQRLMTTGPPGNGRVQPPLSWDVE